MIDARETAVSAEVHFLRRFPSPSANARFFRILLAMMLASEAALLGFNPDHVAIGAIRWDGFMGPPDVIGRQEEANLSSPRFHDRLPFYAEELSASDVRVREINAGQMAKDIAFAVHAGVDYWAFNWYPPGSYFLPGGHGPDLSTALNLYLDDRSPQKLAWCLLFSTIYTDKDGHDNFTSWIPTFVGFFKGPDSRYQTVFNGRPLVYILETNITRDDIAELRRQCGVAGVPNPFIVDMTVSASGTPGTNGWSHIADDARARGADAVSSYVTAQFGGNAYSKLAEQEQSGWDNAAKSGLPVVPWVTFGWDPRPRIDYPELKDGYKDHYYPTDGWAQPATQPQAMDELQRALNWCANHPDAATAGAVIIYGWDELTEGSNQLTPTLAEGTQALDALARVSGRGGQPRSLLRDRYVSFLSSNGRNALLPRRSASGVEWKGDASLPYYGQWLEWRFESTVAVDEIRLAEPDHRTSGFSIAYWDGTQWQEVYRAERAGLIGSSGEPSTFFFPEVATTRLRLQFTGGSGVPQIDSMQLFGQSLPADLAQGRRYRASSQEGVGVAPYWVFHGGGWSPARDRSPEGQWLAVDFGAMTTFDHVILANASGSVDDYRLEASADGQQWTPIAQGQPMGNPTFLNFKRVTAREVRVTLVRVAGQPLIKRFEVHLGSPAPSR